MESILITIRKGLGVPEDYDGFDSEITIAINSAIMSLDQIVVGLPKNFKVTDIDELWSDLYSHSINVEAIKSYILLKSRLEFDPPTNSFLIEAIKEQIKELAWRLSIQTDLTFIPSNILSGIPIMDKPILG